MSIQLVSSVEKELVFCMCMSSTQHIIAASRSSSYSFLLSLFLKRTLFFENLLNLPYKRSFEVGWLHIRNLPPSLPPFPSYLFAKSV